MSPQNLPSGITRRTGARGDSFMVRYTDITNTRRSATFRSRREAEIFRAERLKDRAEGLSGGEQPFREWWVSWTLSRPVSEQTAAKRYYLYTSHLEPVFGHVPLQQITRGDVTRFVSDMAVKPARNRPNQTLAASTVVSTVQLLQAALAAAEAEGVIRTNPAKGQTVPRSRTAKPPRRFVTWEEAQAIEVNMDPHWSTFVPFTMETALRIGETAAVQVQNLDLDEGWVDVRRSLVERHWAGGQEAHLAFETTKTRASTRLVYTLSPDMCERLRDLIKARRLGPKDLLFTGPGGGPLRPSTFRARIWRKAVLAADLADPQPTPHALRHSAISYWLMSGAMTIFEASKLAGHSSSKVTTDVYGHIIDPRAREVQEALWNHRQQSRD